MSRIEAGQEYEAHNARERTTIRIRVLKPPVPGVFGEGKVQVATVAPDGRPIRPRYIAIRQLHDNPARRTGYRLVQHADGTPAGGA